MTTLKMFALSSAVVVLSSLPAMAQQKRLSPHETISARIDGPNLVTIVYGRPYSKDPKSDKVRKVWGELVKYGEPWRLGSDEATTLLTQKPLKFGDTEVPAGVYTLYMVPTEDGGKLAISKTVGAWGIPVDTKNDLARVDLKKETLEKPNDQLQIAVEKNTGGGGVIKIMWEGAQYSAPFSVKK
jgi:hypothetical protein